MTLCIRSASDLNSVLSAQKTAHYPVVQPLSATAVVHFLSARHWRPLSGREPTRCRWVPSVRFPPLGGPLQ